MITVGMNYEILEGKEALFEEKFAAVVEAMDGFEGHERSLLYRDVFRPRSYLIVSEWGTKAQFAAFMRSDAFRAVADWGKEEVLASRPSHVVYDRQSSP